MPEALKNALLGHFMPYFNDVLSLLVQAECFRRAEKVKPNLASVGFFLVKYCGEKMSGWFTQMKKNRVVSVMWTCNNISSSLRFFFQTHQKLQRCV